MLPCLLQPQGLQPSGPRANMGPERCPRAAPWLLSARPMGSSWQRADLARLPGCLGRENELGAHMNTAHRVHSYQSLHRGHRAESDACRSASSV